MKKTIKKTVKRDLIQEQREAFIKANTEPGQGKAFAEVLYREAVYRFPYPHEKVAEPMPTKVAKPKTVLCDSCLNKMTDDEIETAEGDDECLCATCS